MANALAQSINKIKDFFDGNEPEYQSSRLGRQEENVTIASRRKVANQEDKMEHYAEDYTSDVYIARSIMYIKDQGKSVISLINRLKQGQIVIVDRSNVADEKEKTRIFDALYGATVALDGRYYFLDESDKNIIAFTNGSNDIFDETLHE